MSPIAAVSRAVTRLDLFGVGTDGGCWTQWYNGTQWSGWDSLGGLIVSEPSVA